MRIVEGGSVSKVLTGWLRLNKDDKSVLVWNSSTGTYDTVIGGGVGDVDTVDGKHASDFAAASHTHPLSDISGHDKAAHDALDIDADTVDGKHASDLLDKSTYDSDNDGKVESADHADSADSAGDADTVDGKHASDLLDKTTYDSDDDGVVESADHASSADDADTVDGKHADAFLPRDGSLAMSGDLDMNGYGIDHAYYVYSKNGADLALRARESDGTLGTAVFYVRPASLGSGADFLPTSDNLYCLGLDTYRWSDIYAVNTHFGDIGFRERTCVKCGRAFEVGDDIVLRVIRFDEGSGDVMAVPIHARCVEKPKVKVRRMMPVKEERWVWDERRGEFVKVLANKTVARKVKVKRPKPGYTAEDGKFWKVENGRRVEVTAEEALEEAEVEVREVVYEEKEFEV
ncbi:MAG: hypothetical protein ACXQT6_01870 [Candidatus Methanospirareceae archaeon]